MREENTRWSICNKLGGKKKKGKVQDLLWPEAKRVIQDTGDYRPDF